MRVNFGAPILDLKGKPVNEDGKPLTLGSIACQAILMNYPDEQNLEGKEKVRRFTLAMQMVSEGESDMGIEDLALVKKLIAKAYGPLVVGRAYEIIDGPKLASVKEAG